MNGTAKHPGKGGDRAAGQLRPVVAVVLVAASVAVLLGCVLVFPRYLAASDVNHARLSSAELAAATNAVRTGISHLR